MRNPLASVAVGFLAISLQTGSEVAQAAIESQRVAFPGGAEYTALKGELKGDQTVDYILRAGAGQTMTVELKGSNLQNYFNVIAAGTDRQQLRQQLPGPSTE
jgi:DNA-binding sugar fermentation-stimulating protein